MKSLKLSATNKNMSLTILAFADFSSVEINEPNAVLVDDSPDGSNVSGSCAEESIESEESGSDPEHVDVEQSDKQPVKKAQKLKKFFSFGKKKEKIV